MTDSGMDISYIINILGEDSKEGITPVAPPVYQTSNFYFGSVEQFRSAISSEKESWLYSRGNNPTVNLLCRKLAALEGAEEALAFGSGMAAVSAAVLSAVKTGDHVVCVRNPYSWTDTLMSGNMLPKFGVQVSWVDGSSTEEIFRAVKPETRLIYLESPNSWTFEIQDLRAVSAFARQRGITTVIDNSYSSPLYQQPIRMGIDLVVHTASKYLGGHSDVVAGICCGSRERIGHMFANEFQTLGGILSPYNAWLLIRGLRTLPLRMKQASDTALRVMDYLKTQEVVSRIYYPMDPEYGQSGLAASQMKRGSGLFTVAFDAPAAKIEQFCNSLTYWRMAVSWGGYESLIIPSCTFVRPGLYHHLPDNLIRFSAGLEEAEVLIADLDKNLHLLK
jgi:cystathionine beta-lyase/cystathionine gamma-synthase